MAATGKTLKLGEWIPHAIGYAKNMLRNCLYNYITEITGRILKPFCHMLVKLLIHNYCLEMLSCFANSMLLALPFTGCDFAPMKVIQSSISDVKPSTTRSGISMWLSRQVLLRGAFQIMGFSLKSTAQLQLIFPQVKNKPQLKSPSLVAFEYEPLDFHYYKIHPCLQSCSKRFTAKKPSPGQYCTKRT